MEPATSPTVEEQLKALQTQLDDLSKQLAEVTEYVREERRRHQEREELKADLIPIINDVYLLLLEQLDEVQRHVQLEDILHFGKRLLRNLKNFEQLIDQIESLQDFLRDASPLARDAFLTLMKQLDDLERKGYFAFFKEAIRIADNIITHFTPEDVRLLADNIVIILETIKELTQPDVLYLLQEFTETFREVSEHPEEIDVSTRTILRLLRDPHVRRGLVITMQSLRLISLGRGEIRRKNGNAKNSRR